MVTMKVLASVPETKLPICYKYAVNWSFPFVLKLWHQIRANTTRHNDEHFSVNSITATFCSPPTEKNKSTKKKKSKQNCKV